MHAYLSTGRAVVTGLLVLTLATRIVAQERRSLSGNVPEAAAKLTPIGRLEATKSLHLAIGVPLRDQAGLTKFLQDIYDPASPNYRHYLTPEQFTERFGPTAADYQKVIDYARAQGLTVTETHEDRILVDVTGSVAAIEKAFQIKMNVYQHPTESRTFYAPDSEPSVEAGIPIQDISGLSDFHKPKPAMRKPRPLKGAAASPSAPSGTAQRTATGGGTGPGGTFIGYDYRAAYAPGVALTGTGQSVGLYEFDGYYGADITNYENLAGLPHVPLQNVLLNSFDGTPQSSANEEVALDIEMVISMAPGLSKVYVFENNPNDASASPLDILSAMSSPTYTNIKQFACSWFDFGVSATTMDSYFQKMASQGQSFFEASGDYGSYSGAVFQPLDDPYITVVGGTTLATSGAGGPWLLESAWNAGYSISVQNGLSVTTYIQATGGGSSTTYTNPVWQQNLNITANHGSTTKRNSPDVAMVADNIMTVADDGQQEATGGTSAATPLWAAFVALVNQQAAASGNPSVGFLNPAIYALGKSSNTYTATFNDITSGNNTNKVATSFLAVPGYDLCTGWGTPSGGSLIIALAAPDGFLISPGNTLTANGPAGGPFTVSSQNLLLTNSGASSLNWSVGNSPSWLNVSPTSGTLTHAGPATTVTVALNPAVYQFANGICTANLWFTNLTSHFAQLRQVTLLVGQDLMQDGGFESGDFEYWNVFGLYASDELFVDNGTAYTNDIAPYAGNYFADLGNTNALNFISQVLPTRAGQPYLFSFAWACVDALDVGTTTPNQFEVKWNNTTLMNTVNAGAFGWTPTQFVVQATGTTSTVEFAFYNEPAIFGLDAVSVLPIPLPALQNATASGGQIQLSWNTTPGVSYQLQYKTNLSSANWFNLGSQTNATGTTVTESDTIVSGQQRYYRVILIP
jgi:subtilase family serine protease